MKKKNSILKWLINDANTERKIVGTFPNIHDI